jgi:transposase
MLEKGRLGTNAPPYVVGLDVHQKTITLAILDPDGCLVERRTIANSLAELDQFHRELEMLTEGRAVVLGLEASTAGQAAYRHLREIGRDIRMAHPKKLRALFGETKTDKNDALALATVLRLGSFPEVFVPDDETLSLRTLVRLREGVVAKLRRSKQQIRTLLVKNHLNQEGTKFDDIFGVQGLHWLRSLELKDPWDQRELALLLEEGELHTRQAYSLTTELAKVGVRKEEVKLLQTIPGIDYVLALTMIAEVGDIHRFRSRKKFAAYCGLVPKNDDTGQKVAKHAPLRHGNPRMKYALEIAVQAIRKTRKGRFFKLLTRLEARLGVLKAISAVAHRLAFTVYQLWKDRKQYDEMVAVLYGSKRRRLIRRAREEAPAPSVPGAVDKFILAMTSGGPLT